MSSLNGAILECRSLSKSYDDGKAHVEVLRQIDLQVAPAQLIAIVGNSGSGKSTLLHLLGGLDKPSTGSVFVGGKDLALLSENERSKLRNHQLGFVYQFHHLLPEFTALENVGMPLLLRGVAVSEVLEKARNLLELVGLKDRMEHKTGELSGGERQRVAIARALVGNPACVLADEPTGNLDPRNAERVFQLFLDLQKTCQTAVVIVTHDVRIAQQTQQVFKIEDGRLVSL
jgi:lipoprotein-releasing system ATP-binding protein